MIQEGVFPDVADHVIEQCRSALPLLQSNPTQPAAEVVDAVRTLRDQACALSSDLVDQAKKDKSSRNVKNRIKNIIKGIGGAALIGADAAAVAASAATPAVLITAAGAATSAALGGVIIQSAATPAKTRHATS